MYKLSTRSLKSLVGVHPILGFAVTEAIKITEQDFVVIEGVRSIEKQKEYYDKGASRTLDSYHLYGLAVDIVPYVNGGIRWEEHSFGGIADAMKEVIEKYDLPIKWGGDWKSFLDMPHWELKGFKPHYDARKLL